MSYEISQTVPMNCNFCGMAAIQPKIETYYDKYSRETITEAVWICPRCYQRFNAGVLSRKKDEK